MPELLFILVLALLVFGPKRLPQVGKTLGRGLREFRKATSDLKRTVDTELSAVDLEPTRPTPAAVAAVDSSRQAAEPEVSSIDEPEATADLQVQTEESAEEE